MTYNIKAVYNLGGLGLSRISSVKKIAHSIATLISIFLIFSLSTFSNVISDDIENPKNFIIQALYTTNIDGQYERVFRWGTDFYIIGVIRNLCEKTLDLNKVVFEIVDENNFTVYKKDISVISIQPYNYRTLKFRWNCSLELASWSEAGFRFTGKKFFAILKVDNISKKFGFYIDEFGIPRWLRNSIFVSPPYFLDFIPKNMLNEKGVREFYRTIAKRAKEIGFDCLHFARVYSSGYHESHQPSTINYWFPAGKSPYITYSYPRKDYLDISGGDSDKARDLIRSIIEAVHKEGMRVKIYSDPVGMYSPDKIYWNWLNPFYVSEFLKQGYIAVAHHHSSDPGWVRFVKDKGSLKVKRLDFLETKLGISDINYLAVETCTSGPSKLGMEKYGNSSIPGYNPIKPDFDYGFHPKEILPDLNTSPEFDPSFHYQEVKQVLWLFKNYGVDGLCLDDSGRLIMGVGKAKYADDLWHSLIHPTLPSDPDNLYGVCHDDVYCDPLMKLLNADEDKFTLNSYANMVKHIRWQIKYVNPDGFLMSGDYLVPSDVGWKSIVASEDISTSDQFDIWRPSFARWAYRTFQCGYRHLRTDLRRTMMPGLGSQSVIGLSIRPDLTLAIMIATAWANNVNVEISDPNNCRILSLDKSYWTNKEKLIYNYIRMKKEISYLFMEEAQQLLYHKKLKDPIVKIPGEYKFLGGEVCNSKFLDKQDVEEPYTILYTIPCGYGEKFRILHIMNSRVVSQISDNDLIPANYYFKIRIPNGEIVKSVKIVSPDFYKGKVDPDRDGKPDRSFYSDVTKKKGDIYKEGFYWDIEDNYVKIKVPYVISYSGVILEFSNISEKGVNKAKSGLSSKKKFCITKSEIESFK